MANLIVDASYVFHKSYSIYSKIINPKCDLDIKAHRAKLAAKFLTDLTSTLRKCEYTRRVIICADSPNFRTTIDKEYKADRTARPKGFYITLQNCLNALEESGFIVSKVDGLEADDLIGFWSRYLSSKSEECLIISGDKDTHQLINSLVAVYNDNSSHPKAFCLKIGRMRKKLLDVIDNYVSRDNLDEVEPMHVLLEKTLIGDSGDNVPSGFPKGGVGPKTVQKIIKNLEARGDLLDIVANECWNLLSLAIISSTKKEFSIDQVANNFYLTALLEDNVPNHLKENAIENVNEKFMAYKYKGDFYAKRILLNSSFPIV